jgi:uncharacterized membrane protein HdeD (DUF308 family)
VSDARQQVAARRTEEDRAMKTATLVGIALLVVGVLALAYQGITYTTREKVVDIGPIKASVEKQKTIPLPPVLGGLALVGGVVLIAVGARSRA